MLPNIPASGARSNDLRVLVVDSKPTSRRWSAENVSTGMVALRASRLLASSARSTADWVASALPLAESASTRLPKEGEVRASDEEAMAESRKYSRPVGPTRR